MYIGGSNQKQVTCHNCRFNVTNITRQRGFKCPRCRCGLFDGWDVESEIDPPNSGGNSPDVRGKPLASP